MAIIQAIMNRNKKKCDTKIQRTKNNNTFFFYNNMIHLKHH